MFIIEIKIMNFIIKIIVNLRFFVYTIKDMHTSYYREHFWNYKILNINKMLHYCYIEITTFIEIILQNIIEI